MQEHLLPVTALDYLSTVYQNNPDVIPPLIDIADTIYCRILTDGRCRRGSISPEIKAPLSVAVAMRVSGRHFSWVPLCRWFDVSARDLKPRFLQISKWKWPKRIICNGGQVLTLPLKQHYTTADASMIIPLLATRLHKTRYTKSAENLYYALVGDNTEVTSRQPETVAAVMLYLACNANGRHLSAYRIAHVAGSNITSIYQFSNELKAKFGEEKIKEASKL